MSDANWKSTSIPAALYDHVQAQHVPSRAASVQAYVAFWTRVGTLVDHVLMPAESELRLDQLRSIINDLRGERFDDDQIG